MPKKFFQSTPPDKCDWCSGPIKDVFIDGLMRTVGRWANLCPKCHAIHGAGLGLGQGQEFTRQEDGRWLKTGG